MERGHAVCSICKGPENYPLVLVAPCKCRGNSKYVHSQCIDDLRNAQLEAGNIPGAISCPVCNANYIGTDDYNKGWSWIIWMATNERTVIILACVPLIGVCVAICAAAWMDAYPDWPI